ncbi:hypothetical protein EDB92DRAFT_1935645 [Lactarius akahatsu]|uniref:Elongator complex protein 5 n=1 Tax=Lactarius akahatsu TaxID=416441 RepID=A0AAD4LIQ2_9AGAM|nr:hypothetical protein EDB92DRAFT_1935645 [Lactarius akahatsu]
MTHRIATIVSGESRPHFPFVILQSSLVQSSLPVLRTFVNKRDVVSHVILFSLLYPPLTLVDPSEEGLQIVDMRAEVPGYSETRPDPLDYFSSIVKQALSAIAPDGPLTVIIDAADVLCADLGSPSQTCAVITSLLSHISARPKPSRLVIHLTTPSPLRDHILAPRLSPTLAHVVAHPPALLLHLATAQLMPPPPAGRPDRFWHVFSPLASRTWEVEEIVLGPGGGGARNDWGDGDRSGVGRNLEKELLGWLRDSPCSLSELDSLKPIFEDVGKTASEQLTPHLSFNLNLTPEQQQSRTNVPLPYAHKGMQYAFSFKDHSILYDPDSADDIDDEDPDDDLNI